MGIFLGGRGRKLLIRSTHVPKYLTSIYYTRVISTKSTQMTINPNDVYAKGFIKVYELYTIYSITYDCRSQGKHRGT